MTMNPPRQSKSKQLADGIAKEVERRFSKPTVSKLAPNFDVKTINDLEISVWPQDRRSEVMTRDTAKSDYDIAIGVVQRIQPNDDEDLLSDELLALVENIGDKFLGDILDIGGNVEVVGFEHLPLYDRAYLETHRIFGAGITLQLTRQEQIPDR